MGTAGVGKIHHAMPHQNHAKAGSDESRSDEEQNEKVH
jgi:hypothetical protein